MRKLVVITLALFFSMFAVQNGFAQGGSNGSVGGVVQDSSSALIPGVTVTLTNTQTGVVDTRLTNESGVYNFPSVPPGTYKLSGDLTGFTSDIKNNIAVNTGNQIRLDLVLRVGGAPATSVTVNSEADNNRIRETSSSVAKFSAEIRCMICPASEAMSSTFSTCFPAFARAPVAHSSTRLADWV